MRYPRRVLGAMVPMLLFGVIAVYRHSENLLQVSQDVSVRDIVGLTAGGATCGAALTGVIVGLWRARTFAATTPRSER
jgi:hypothetical protein